MSSVRSTIVVPFSCTQVWELHVELGSKGTCPCPQHRWTCQLLCGSALLPRTSTLKLASLPLASGASLSLAFYARSPPTIVKTSKLHSQVQGLRGGMTAKERSQHQQNH